MAEFPKKLGARLDKRKEEGSFRILHTQKSLVDFTSNDYLGFSKRQSGHHTILSRGSTGSRLISGNHRIYAEVEEITSIFHRAETSLIYNSGYDANIGLLSALLLRGDYVFYDQSIHASIRDGISLGKARAFKYRHNDLENLKERVNSVLPTGAPEGSEVYVITESVFSIEGDGPDIQAFAGFCTKNGFRFIVDEAHATGVLGPQGRGEVVGQGCEEEVFARIVTFGKSMGCHGAAVLGGRLLRDYQINFSRSLIYTTALPPVSLHGILKAYESIQGDPGSVARASLLKNIHLFSDRIRELGLSDHMVPARAAVHCCEIGGNSRVKTLSEKLRDAGYDVKPILSPTVPRGRECLRFSLHAYNTPAQIREVLTILAQALKTDTHGE